jgi:hypothetical protein
LRSHVGFANRVDLCGREPFGPLADRGGNRDLGDRLQLPARCDGQGGRAIADALGVAGPDRLDGQHDRLQPGTANLVNCESSDRLGQAGEYRRLPRRVLTDARRDDVSYDHFIDRSISDVGPCYQRLDASRPELRGRHARKRPIHAPIGVRTPAKIAALSIVAIFPLQYSLSIISTS